MLSLLATEIGLVDEAGAFRREGHAGEPTPSVRSLGLEQSTQRGKLAACVLRAAVHTWSCLNLTTIPQEVAPLQCPGTRSCHYALQRPRCKRAASGGPQSPSEAETAPKMRAGRESKHI